MAGYSDAEYVKHIEHIMAHPNCKYWTTEQGHMIPFIMLNDDHLTNVIKHLKKRVENFPTTAKLGKAAVKKVLNELETEKKKRLIKASPAGKILYG